MWTLVISSAFPATLAEVFPPPAGFERVAPEPFGAWLQARQVRDEGVPVRTHDGRVVAHRARVIELPLVAGDLQQCADSVIRLRAEWLRETGAGVSFHATSGDPIPWSRWSGGERPFEAGGRLQWRPGTDGGWEAYLRSVFTWAGTRSLAFDTRAVSVPEPGDLLVAPGSPGHAVLLVDVAQLEGEIRVLVAEGYMPAQDFHVELGPYDGWWAWEDGVALPHWTLPASGLRRF